jgi:DNA-directed RNA polymerase subunit RPC12/RpoP
MAEKKMCPHCGGQMFMTKITRAGLAEFSTDPNEPCKILKESKDKFDIEIVGCARCKQNVSFDDLVTGVKCKECGRVVGPMDINTDGICNVCEAVKQRTELANASREDLIKMLLDAEKKTNPVTAKIEKQIEKADMVTPVAAPAPIQDEPTDINDILDAPSEEQPVEKKKRTRARKKKDDEDVAVEQVESENTAEEITEETVSVTEEVVDDIANQQEAPFPDIAMNPPEEPVAVVEEQPVAQDAEQPIGADFRMFDEEEEAF